MIKRKRFHLFYHKKVIKLMWIDSLNITYMNQFIRHKNILTLSQIIRIPLSIIYNNMKYI